MGMNKVFPLMVLQLGFCERYRKSRLDMVPRLSLGEFALPTIPITELRVKRQAMRLAT